MTRMLCRTMTERFRKMLFWTTVFLFTLFLSAAVVDANLYLTHDQAAPFGMLSVCFIGAIALLAVLFYYRNQQAKTVYTERLEREFPRDTEHLMIEEKRFIGEMREKVKERRKSERAKKALLQKVAKASFLTGQQADQCDTLVDDLNEAIETGAEEISGLGKVGRGVGFDLPRNEADYMAMRPVVISAQ